MMNFMETIEEQARYDGQFAIAYAILKLAQAINGEKAPAEPPPPVVKDPAKRRMLDTQQAAKFCAMSLPHFRRLYRLNKVPQPFRLGGRVLRWYEDELAAWRDAKSRDTFTPFPVGGRKR
jgi:predicted DNA-binding transcriptional regulator AlpA